MPSINLDLQFFSHRKIRRLCSKLGDWAEIIPIKIWIYTGSFHPEDGIIEGYNDEELLSMAGVKYDSQHDATSILQALCDSGWLVKTRKGYKVHEWLEYQGHIAAYSIRGKNAAMRRWGNLTKNGKNHATSIPEAMPEVCLTNALTDLTDLNKTRSVKNGEEKSLGDLDGKVSTVSVLDRMIGRFSSPMPEAEDFQDQDPPKPKPEPEDVEQYPEIGRKHTKEPVLEPQGTSERVEERKSTLSLLKGEFEKARKAYPGQKVGADPAWKHFIKKHGIHAVKIIPLLLPAIEAEVEHKHKLTASGLFCPQWKSFERWINGSYWTQDLEKIQFVLNQNGKQSTFEAPSNLKERV